jgi:glycosyltransferase involved in cell wall biosynthesis
MNVTHVSRYFHPWQGGTEQAIASLTRELAPLGVDSRVLVTDRRRNGPGPDPHVPVVAVPAVGPERFPVPRGGFGSVVRELQAPDIVHLHDVRFLFETTALVRRGPVVVSTHGLLFHTARGDGLKRAAWRSWIAPRLRAVDAVVAVSDRDAELCAGAGIDTVTIPNGVDVERFLALDDSSRRRTGPLRLLYFGRVVAEKDVASLAGLLRARPEWRLSIVGAVDDAYRSELDAAMAPVRNRVEVTGAVSDAALLAALEASDCVVLPSTGEAFGYTLVEAMASGVPIVAADLAAYRGVAAGTRVGFARFAEPSTAVDVVESTVAAWDGDAARRRAREFSPRAAAIAYRKVYDEVVGP